VLNTILPLEHRRQNKNSLHTDIQSITFFPYLNTQLQRKSVQQSFTI